MGQIPPLDPISGDLSPYCLWVHVAINNHNYSGLIRTKNVDPHGIENRDSNFSFSRKKADKCPWEPNPGWTDKDGPYIPSTEERSTLKCWQL